jgi:chromosome segregation ATPase
LAASQAETQEHGEQLATNNETLESRQLQLDEAEQRLAASQAETQELREQLTADRAALESRQLQLDEAEQQLTASQAETQELCEQLAADHAEFAEQSATLREQMTAEHRQAMADVELKRQAVGRRAEQVDQRWSALQQVRSELGRIQRETLEIRLATEELWAQLSGVAPPAALTQSLGRIRAKLAQQYAQANVEAVEQRKTLEAIRGQLAAEHEKLVEQKRQFERWAAACREDCQQQASRLVAREQQLRDEKILLHQQLQRWQAERLRYQLELRRLQSQVGVGEESPTMAD